MTCDNCEDEIPDKFTHTFRKLEFRDEVDVEPTYCIDCLHAAVEEIEGRDNAN